MSEKLIAIIFLIIGSVIALMLTGCGEGTMTQCNSIGKITIAAEAVGKELSAQSSKDPVKEAKLFAATAAKMWKLRQSMQNLSIQDKQLHDIQSRFVIVYQDYSKSLNQVARGFKTQDDRVFNQAITDVKSVKKKEDILATELSQYCTGK
jgi:hypothetical protein